MKYTSGPNPTRPDLDIHYLESVIAESSETDIPRYGIAADGYTVSSGAPSGTMIRLRGEKRWRRIMYWCFSNASTSFIRHGGKSIIVDRLRQVPETLTTRGQCP